MQSNTQLLTEAIIVTPLIDVWSGEVTVHRDVDLPSAADLPPSRIYSDGRKRVINPKVIAKLQSQRRMTQADLAKFGFRSPVGYIIAPDKEKALYEALEERKQAFEDAKADLIQNLDVYYAEWEQEPEAAPFTAFLKRNRPDAARVSAACSYDFAVFRVAPVDSEVGQQQFEAVAKTTVPALMQDIASSARDIVKSSIGDRPKVTQRALIPVRALVSKMRSFCMFDPRILPTAEALEQVLDGLPRMGPLSDSDTLILKSMLASISDPDNVLAAGERLLAKQSAKATGNQASEEQDEDEEDEVASTAAPATPTNNTPPPKAETPMKGRFAAAVF